MGVSKKIAEMYISALGKQNGTQFMAVRVGNVLGSEGSVITVFKRQIESGGPVTITHKDIKRYFMTIPEAAGLVLEAGFLGQGGEVFILEMGRQIRIVDLAIDMIKLSGLEPYKDIDMVYTGLRPGEKLYEDLIAADERLLKTSHDKINVVTAGNVQENIIPLILDLKRVIVQGSGNEVQEKIKEIIPHYNPVHKVSSKESSLVSSGKDIKSKKDTVIAS